MKSVRHVIGNVHTFTSRFRRDELIRSVCLSVARCVKLQIYSVDDHVLCNIHTHNVLFSRAVFRHNSRLSRTHTHTHTQLLPATLLCLVSSFSTSPSLFPSQSAGKVI